MGFGLLFIGYLIAFPMTVTLYGWALRIVGCIVMAVGCRRISEYFRGFRYPCIISVLYAVSGVAEGVFWAIGRFVGDDAVPASVKSAEGWCWFAVVLIFHLVLNCELSLADAEVGISAQRSTALTAAFISVLWAATYVLGKAKLIAPGFYPMMLFVLMAITAVAVYGSYRHICPEGEEGNMSRRKTGVGFVDRFFEELDKREARAVETTRAEIEERKRKREESRQSKRKSKK